MTAVTGHHACACRLGVQLPAVHPLTACTHVRGTDAQKGPLERTRCATSQEFSEVSCLTLELEALQSFNAPVYLVQRFLRLRDTAGQTLAASLVICSVLLRE